VLQCDGAGTGSQNGQEKGQRQRSHGTASGIDLSVHTIVHRLGDVGIFRALVQKFCSGMVGLPGPESVDEIAGDPVVAGHADFLHPGLARIDDPVGGKPFARRSPLKPAQVAAMHQDLVKAHESPLCFGVGEFASFFGITDIPVGRDTRGCLRDADNELRIGVDSIVPLAADVRSTLQRADLFIVRGEESAECKEQDGAGDPEHTEYLSVGCMRIFSCFYAYDSILHS